VVERIKLGYHIGQYPAINHSYLVAEVRHPRDGQSRLRWRRSARPSGGETRAEQEEAARST
jgi:hypothetical protein